MEEEYLMKLKAIKSHDILMLTGHFCFKFNIIVFLFDYACSVFRSKAAV